MIPIDNLYTILVVYGLIAFGIGFAFSKNLSKEKIDDLLEIIRELKPEIKK